MTPDPANPRNRIKSFLNRQANVGLAKLDYSDPMIRDAKREAWWWFQARAHALSRRTGLLSGQAVIWTAPGQTELLPVEVPRARDGEVTLRILTSVISTGTERAQYLRLPNTTVVYPHRPGYAGAGLVIAAGSNVANVKPGDLVAARNVPHMSVVTAPASWIHRIPAGVRQEDAALAQLGVICGQGIRRAAIEPDEPVCVLGAGLVGALALRLATAAGAGPVTVIARSNRKERSARAGGAARFLIAESDEVAALASPVVIEATGEPRALGLAVEAAARGGRVILLGSPRGSTHDVPIEAIRAKRLRLVGAHVDTLRYESRLTGIDLYEREAQAFLDHLAGGLLSVADLVEVTIDPREADAFYRALPAAPDIVGARFDWTLLPPEEQVHRGRLCRLPDLTGAGVDPRKRPLRPGGRRHGRVSLFEHADPLAEASGRLRVGLMGCGEIAVLNAAAIAATPNVELVACYDPVSSLAEDLAATHRVDSTTTSEELLERDDVDAVLIASPHHLHYPLGAAAASAGKHVIVEKPLAHNLPAAVELVQAADRAGVVLSVCFPQRYAASVIVARRLIAAGALGETFGVLLNFFMDKPPSYWIGGFSSRAHSDWRGSREQAGGGVLIMNLSHYVDLIRHLTGLEVEAVSSGAQSSEQTAEVEDAVSVTVRYANGALGSLFANAALRGSGIRSELRLWGPAGHLALEPDPLVYTSRALDGLKTNRWQTFGRLPETDTRAAYFSRLATALEQKRAPDVTASDALAVQAFIQAAYRSSELGQSISPAALLEEALV
jgi:2-desacetyl-2-hydroxyethyl bacteriochlorophyllide A dehydrogenase